MHSRDHDAWSHDVAGCTPPVVRPERGNYGDYLHLAELKASHQPRTQVHAEGRFIGLHQAAELLFGRQIEELELVITYLDGAVPDVPAALACLRRARGLTEQLTSLLTLLTDMISPEDFAAFRPALGSASGVQSVQFWEVEILSGHRKTVRGRLRGLDVCSEDRALLERRLASPTVWDAFGDVVGCRTDDAEELANVLLGGGTQAELANALRMHDLDWVRWRTQHAMMVEAMIGSVAPGTGGSNGSRYLWSRVQTRFYPILHEATSLVHQPRAVAS
jgi:tryptophan 2,3-dioxygenase